MTRINCGIPPAELSDKHLLAEHREIKRIPNMVYSGKAKLDDIPEKFTLGKGHVKFFYNKLWYLYRRYQTIFDECGYRGFNITSYHEAFEKIVYAPDGKFNHLWNLYEPTEEDKALIRQRIKERTNGTN